jgi:sulfatase maturation enzyme AslB (radical SAM superfamily)
MKQRVRAMWHLNRNCNFNCSYYYIQHFTKDEPGHGVDVDVDAFKQNKINWQILSLTGGEPFIYPDFVELCKKLTGFTKISVVTNCSTSNVYDFADALQPREVDHIHCSLHLGERPRKDFELLSERVLYLRDKGFSVFVSQVIHPSLFAEYVKAYSFFEKKGILVCPKVFKGVYWFKEYPAGYDQVMRKNLLKYFYQSKNQIKKTFPHEYELPLYGSLSWRDDVCNAGYDHMQIQYNGDAYRCHSDKRFMGNLYEGTIRVDAKPQRCMKPVCECVPEGWRGHTYNGVVNQKMSIKSIGKNYMVSLLSKVRGG